MSEDLEFGISDLEFKISDLEFGISDLEFGISDLEFEGIESYLLTPGALMMTI